MPLRSKRTDLFLQKKFKKLLLMGSSAFDVEGLPVEIRNGMDKATVSKWKIIVGEVPRACSYQDYFEIKKLWKGNGWTCYGNNGTTRETGKRRGTRT